MLNITLVPIEYDDNDTEPSFFMSSDPNDNPPIIAFHGVLDEEIAYYDTDDAQDYNNSTDNAHKKEKRCLESPTSSDKFIIKSTGTNNTVYVTKASGLNMYNFLKSTTIDRLSELYTDSDAGHGLDGVPVFPNVYTSDYGTGYDNDTQVTQYIAQRAAVFFQIVMLYNQAHSLAHPPFRNSADSHFIDCKNLRMCGQADNNECT